MTIVGAAPGPETEPLRVVIAEALAPLLPLTVSAGRTQDQPIARPTDPTTASRG